LYNYSGLKYCLVTDIGMPGMLMVIPIPAHRASQAPPTHRGRPPRPTHPPGATGATTVGGFDAVGFQSCRL